MSNVIRIAAHYKALAEKLQGKVDDQRRVLLKVKDELVEGKELKKHASPISKKIAFWGLTDTSRQKPVMEAEITKLRQAVSQLRAQLSSAQLSSLDYDVPPYPQLSETEIPHHQQHSSPTATVTGIDDQHKRKANSMIDDPASRARDFRREMNKRQTMPPPALPQRMEQQPPDTTGGEQYHEQRHVLDQEHVDMRSEGYNNQFQQLGYSPQQQRPYRDQPVFRGAPTGQFAYQGNNEHQFIDLTGSPGPSVSPSNPRYGFIQQQQQQHNSSQLRSGYGNQINIPFRSPLKTPTTRPINSLPVRGPGGRYFLPSNRPSPGTGTGYGNIPPSLQAGRNSFCPPVSRAEHLSPLTRQGGDTGYINERGGQLQPNIPNKGGGSVVSPFFTDPPSPPKNLGLFAIGDGVRRPASVAGFAGKQGGLSRSYGRGLGDGGFFSRQDDVVRGVAVPHWNTSISASGGRGVRSFAGNSGVIRPGTVGGFGGSRGGDIFGPQRGGRDGIFGGGVGASEGGSMDRPGLRRSVRRD